MDSTIELQCSDHQLSLVGTLTVNSVLTIRTQALQFIQQMEKIVTVDLQELHHTDSAGLVLLLEWLSAAMQWHKRLAFTHVPQQLLALASVSGVEHLFRSNSNG